MNTDNIIFKDLKIQHISKSSLKHSYINVTKESKIILKTPKVNSAFVENLLKDKEAWIRKQLLKMQQNPPIFIKLKKEILFFGKIYDVNTKKFNQLQTSFMRLKKPTRENIIRCYDRFYKDYAVIYLTDRVKYFAKEMFLSYKELKFKKMLSRWGSCSSQRVITLNTKLLYLSHKHIDYVIVHELAHLVHMNHSKDFYTLIEHYILDSKNIQKEIRFFNPQWIS